MKKKEKKIQIFTNDKQELQFEYKILLLEFLIPSLFDDFI
mgnify:CR=1 FL=1